MGKGSRLTGEKSSQEKRRLVTPVVDTAFSSLNKFKVDFLDGAVARENLCQSIGLCWRNDHALFRQGIKRILQDDPNLTVIGPSR